MCTGRLLYLAESVHSVSRGKKSGSRARVEISSHKDIAHVASYLPFAFHYDASVMPAVYSALSIRRSEELTSLAVLYIPPFLPCVYGTPSLLVCVYGSTLQGLYTDF